LQILALLVGIVAGTWFPFYFWGDFGFFSGELGPIVVLTWASIIHVVEVTILLSLSLIASQKLRVSLFRSAYLNFGIGYTYSLICTNIGYPLMSKISFLDNDFGGFLVLPVVVFLFLILLVRLLSLYPSGKI
jgi:hypothetical protein